MGTGGSDPCWVVDLGQRGFLEAWELQRRLVLERQAGRLPDVLVLLEHPPTYTLGRAARKAHVLADPGALAGLGASLVETDRGGDVTYHGPGQIVGYPIFHLGRWNKDVHLYLRGLEEVLLRALAEHGVEAFREPGLTGVWHQRGKLGAIGVRVSRWVASHGFALNVATDLDYFKHIVPCGIVGRSVSSMEDVLGEPVALSPVKTSLARAFGEVFGRELARVPESALEARIV